jgi:parallel beta-helix repeat protein
LGLAGSPYVVQSYISVNGGVTLTVQPGVVVSYNTGAHMDVYGTLYAVGTPSRPITFTSAISVPHAGDWENMWFNSGSRLRLSYCTVAYAGYYNYDTLQLYTGDAILSHCTVRDNSANGIRLEGSGNRPTLDTLTLTNNGGYAIWQNSPAISAQYLNLSASSNGADAIGTAGNIDEDTVWDVSQAELPIRP